MRNLNNRGEPLQSRGNGSGSNARQRNTHKIVKKIRLLNEMIAHSSQYLDWIVETCKEPSDLDGLLPQLHEVQRRLAHRAKRLEYHIQSYESWKQEESHGSQDRLSGWSGKRSG